MDGTPLRGRVLPHHWWGSQLAQRTATARAFNAANKWVKRGLCMVPMRYGVSHSFMAGTSCLVTVHGGDGTVEVHHAGTEIGQGINTKVAQMVAVTLGCSIDKIFVHGQTWCCGPTQSSPVYAADLHV